MLIFSLKIRKGNKCLLLFLNKKKYSFFSIHFRKFYERLLIALDINFSFTKRRIFSNQHHRGSLIHIDKKNQDLISDYFVTFR